MDFHEVYKENVLISEYQQNQFIIAATIVVTVLKEV